MSPQGRIVRLNLALFGIVVAALAGSYALMRGPLGIEHWTRLLRSGKGRERFEAASALRSLGPKSHSAVPALLEILANPDDGLATAAAGALVQIDAERAYLFARDLAVRLERGEVRPGAGVIRVLDSLGPVAWRAIPTLRKLLRDDDREKSGKTAWALLRIGHLGDDVIASILERTEDARFHVRWEALMQIDYLGLRARSLRSAVERLSNDSSPAISSRAKLILTNLDRSAMYRLGGLRGFARVDDSYQQYALIELAKLGPEAAPVAGEITSSLRHPSALIRFLAIRALVELGREAAQTAGELRPLLRDPATLVRDGAAAALQALETSR